MLYCPRDAASGGLNMRKIIVATCALMGLTGCAASESVQQAAIQNCLQVGITQSDPQFATCTRSYALQRQDGALNQNYNLYTIQQDMKQQDWRLNRRQDAFSK